MCDVLCFVSFRVEKLNFGNVSDASLRGADERAEIRLNDCQLHVGWPRLERRQQYCGAERRLQRRPAAVDDQQQAVRHGRTEQRRAQPNVNIARLQIVLHSDTL